MLLLAAGALGAAAPTAVGEEPADPRVKAGREALSSRLGGYDWYDEQADAVQRIDVRPPRDWTWDWAGPNLSGLGQGLALSVKILAWTVLAGLLALMVYLLIRAYLRLEHSAAATAGTEDPGLLEAARIEALPDEVRRDAANLLGAARRYYQQGDYREAMIYLFSHELLQLDRGQRIRLARGKTNRQYLRETGGVPALAALFEHAMLTFEAVFFGNHPLDRAGFEACWSRLPELERLAQGDAA